MHKKSNQIRRKGGDILKCQLGELVVNYEVKGSGIPVVMLHGFSLDHHVLSGCMEPIFEKREGYRRIYLDLPGMGETSSRNWIKNSDHMLNMVLEFMNEIIPRRRFLVVGESYGGYLARGVLQRRFKSVDGLMMVCPVVIPDDSKRTLPKKRTIVKDSKLLPTLSDKAREMFESLVVQNTKTWERFRDDVYVSWGKTDEDDPFLNRLRNEGYAFSFDADKLNEPFRKPVLLLAGKQDDVVGYSDAFSLMENYPRGTFAVLDKAGHNLQIEQEGLFNAMVNEWLDRVEESRGK